MTVGIYIRVSTQEQAQEGYSIPAQKERLTAYCKAQGWGDYRFYIDDGVSGRGMERPKLKLLLDHVKEANIDIVLVYRLDRFTRSVRDLHKMLEMLNEHKCGFKSATEVYDTTTAMGRLFITIVAALAEWESDNSSERIKMALEEKASSGEWIGNVPYCFNIGENERLVKNDKVPVVLDIIKKIKSGMSARQVAEFLTKTNNDKKAWHPTTVLRILRNPAIYGATSWLDKVYENTHEGIISKDEFIQLQQILNDRSQYRRRDVKSDYLFQGVLTCPKCGLILTVNRFIRKKTNGTEYQGAIYRCQTCRNKGKKTKDIGERRFLKALYEYMVTVKIDTIEIPDEPDEQLTYVNQLQQMERKREKYQRAWASDLISDEEFKKMMDETRKVYDELKKKIDEYEKPPTIDIESIKNIVSTFNQNFKLLAQEEKRTFISTFIRKIKYKLISQPPKRPDKHKTGKDLVVVTNVEFH